MFINFFVFWIKMRRFYRDLEGEEEIVNNFYEVTVGRVRVLVNGRCDNLLSFLEC